MSWNKKISIRKSSIDGYGVFAEEQIKKGETVWCFDNSMHVCDEKTLLSYDSETLKKALLAGYWHVPSEKFIWYEDGMEYLNHGKKSEANIATLEWSELHEDKCVALRDIEKGEELLEDYNFWKATNLSVDHWLVKMYKKHHPEHFSFMSMLK